MTIQVITDSAADLTAAVMEAEGIRMVPLTVEFGREAYFDQVDLVAAEFWKRLAGAGELPRTAAPSPEAFADVYAACLSAGARGIVSVHLSGSLSGTYRNAEAAARMVPGDIRVVDAQSASLGTGLLAIWAARAGRWGLDAASAADATRRLAAQLRVYFSLGTLEYLARGGRIGQAARLVGGMLDVKPLLTLASGSVHPLRRVRGARQVAPGLVSALLDSGIGGQVVVAALVTSPGVDPALMDEVRERVGRAVSVRAWREGVIGPVIGVHAGPGAFGLVVLPLEGQDLDIWEQGDPGGQAVSS